jgi:hypothetical protein
MTGVAYCVRIPESVIAELVANENGELRKRLLSIERMLRCPGDIAFPVNSVLENLVRYYETHRSDFDWTKMSIRSQKLEDAIARTFPEDKLATAQKKQAYEAADKWDDTFKRLSRSYDDLRNEGNWPASLEKTVALFQQGSALRRAWGKMLYKKDDGTDADDASVEEFYERCPPFRSVVIAMLVSQFERCFRDIRTGGTSFRAGRVDTLMATYLPYCNIFVSDDPKQINLLQAVIVHAKLSDCSVLSCPDFIDQLTLIKGSFAP